MREDDTLVPKVSWTGRTVHGNIVGCEGIIVDIKALSELSESLGVFTHERSYDVLEWREEGRDGVFPKTEQGTSIQCNDVPRSGRCGRCERSFLSENGWGLNDGDNRLPTRLGDLDAALNQQNEYTDLLSTTDNVSTFPCCEGLGSVRQMSDDVGRHDENVETVACFSLTEHEVPRLYAHVRADCEDLQTNDELADGGDGTELREL
ncbi:hypothetical protein PC129_g20112 [Phytophthora cactorum]|uniref:Uncharacterized protein n=1 Tax=Phytophthora cactorum TaxID=29920 RepID=A0A8T1HA07_9STRA|nr:hypothetical protein PC129_g20112 [Phytophthora cactorum]